MSEWLDNVRAFIQNPEVPGVAGAILSLKWMPVGSTWANKFSSMAFGLCVAVFIVPYLLEVVGIKSTAAIGAFSFIGGLFGLLLLSRAWDYISTTPFGELLTSIFTKRPQ